MTDKLQRLYNACNPLKAAEKGQYVNAADVRGSQDLSRQFLRELRSIRGDFLTFLFTGHLGCGKSSELHHLAEQLRKPPSGDRYFPIILDAEEFVDSYDATSTDVLLSILARFAEEMASIGIVLQDTYLRSRLSDAMAFLLKDVEVPDAEVGIASPLAKFAAKFRLLKSDPTNRELVRKALQHETSTLKEEIRLQFEKARERLAEDRGKDRERYKDFVLIIDNLEKIDRIKGQEEGYHSHRQFFIDGASQLTDLGAHVVYTVPLPLVIRDGNELAARYGSRPFVLPMIKTEERPPQHKPYQAGRERLQSILQKRAETTPIEDLVEPDALKLLIDYCGGHTRQLITFLRSAITLTDAPPITVDAAHQAVADTASLYSRMPLRYWPILARLEVSADQMIDQDNDDIKAMLQQLIVLEYRNGGAHDDTFSHAVPWYAVHPIVRQLRPFKRELAALKPKRTSKAGNDKAKSARPTRGR